MDNVKLDKKDKEILRIVSVYARMSFTDIGKIVGLSRVAVKNRIERMEKLDVIKGYKAILNSESQEISRASDVEFVLYIETTPDYLEDVAEYLSYDKRIKQIYLVTGSSKLRAVGLAKNNEDAGLFMRNLSKKTKGIVKLDFDILATVLKDVDKGVDYVRIKREKQENCDGNGQPSSGNYHC